MQNVDKPIGIFDSGLGGLTVVRECMRQISRENIIYFGDTARLPYGAKSARAVIGFSLQNGKFLSTFGIKLLIVACNTASALSLSLLKETFSFPIVGVIEPGCRAAASATSNKRVGVIGTEVTIASGAYEEAIRKIDPSVKVFSQACPLFVPLVEEGWLTKKVNQMVAEEYLSPLKEEAIDTLILGCTHYPLLRKIIQNEMGKKVKFVDSAVETVREVEAILEDKDMLRSSGNRGEHRYYVSDISSHFIPTGELFLGEKISPLERIDIEEF